MESLFLSRLEALQPDPGYMALLRAVVQPFGGGTQPQYAVTADGQRFLGLERVGGGKAFTFLLNSLNAKSANGSVPVR